MDRSRRQSFNESEDSLDTCSKPSSDIKTDSLESISSLNIRHESFLYVSKKPESTTAQSNEQFDTSQSSGFKENEPEISSRQSNIEKTSDSSLEPSSRRTQTPESRTTVDDKLSCASKNKGNTKQNVGIQFPKESPEDERSYSLLKPQYSPSSQRTQTPESTKSDNDGSSSAIKKTGDTMQDLGMQSPGDQMSYSLPKPRNFSRTDAKLCPPRYDRSVNPAFPSPSTNLRRHQTYAYPGQYSEQRLMNANTINRPNIDRLHYQWEKELPSISQNKANRSRFSLPNHSAMNSYQWEFPMTNRTRARPILLSRNRMTCLNPLPPIRTKATPIQYSRRSSYENPMPPIKTNATPMRYVQSSSRYRNPLTSISTDKIFVQLPQTSSSTSTEGMKLSPGALKSKSDLTSDHVLTSPVIQSNSSTPRVFEDQNTSIPIQEEPKKPTKLEELAKKVHYSKKNILTIDIPKEEPVKSFFPLHSTAKGGIVLRQTQQSFLQLPTPSGRNYFRHNFEEMGAFGPIPPYLHPVVADQPASRPTIQNNLLIQSGSATGNPTPLTIQNQIRMPQRVQLQPAIQNLDAVPQYQNPNTPFSQFGAQCVPSIQNLTAAPQYQNPNTSMCQYGAQFQPSMQNLTAEPQFNYPNTPINEYGIQHPFMQNITPEPQCHDPNTLLYQYGPQTSSETFYIPDAPCFSTYDASISVIQCISNAVPIQTFSVNPFSSSVIQNPTCAYSGSTNYPLTDDPNTVPNISGIETSVENSSSISVSQYPSVFYTVNESENQISTDDPNQTSRTYQHHVSTNNPEIENAIYPARSSLDDVPN